MRTWFELIVWAMLVLVLLPIATLSIECIVALFPRRHRRSSTASFEGRLAVVVPAHNEQDVLRMSIESIKRQLTADDRLVVVADNCNDRTSSIARQFDAEVIERHDTARRGKGFAMDFARCYLAQSPPDVVVFVDADCELHDGALRVLASTAAAAQRPVQAAYIMNSPSDATTLSRISAFAFNVKNLVRPLGLSRMGGPCLLTGSGMAFPWQVLKTFDLADGSTGEDYMHAAKMTMNSRAPIFQPDAWVTSHLPQNAEAATGQRRRWVHSHLSVLLEYGPRLLAQGIMSARLNPIVLSVELIVPPLSLLFMLWGVIMTLTSLAILAGASPLPAVVCALGGLAMSIAITGACLRFGPPIIRLSDIWGWPAYVMSKVPHFTSYILCRHKTWNRTRRDPQTQSDSVRDVAS